MASARATPLGTLQQHLQNVEKAIEKVRTTAQAASIKEGKTKIKKTANGPEEEITIHFETHLNTIKQLINQIVILIESGGLSAAERTKLVDDTLPNLAHPSLTQPHNSPAWLAVNAEVLFNPYYDDHYFKAQDKSKFLSYSDAVNELVVALKELGMTLKPAAEAGTESTPLTSYYYTPSYVTLYANQQDWLNAMGDFEVTKEVENRKHSPREVSSFRQRVEAFSKRESGITEDVMGLKQDATPAATSRPATKSSSPTPSGTPRDFARAYRQLTSLLPRDNSEVN